MKILLLSDGIYPYVLGGMQKHSASIGIELVKQGYSVDLYHFVPKGNSIPTKEEVNRFHFNSNKGFNKIFCLYFPTSIRFPGHYLWNSYRYSKSVFEIIKKNNFSYDFIYSKGFTSWRLLYKRKELIFKPKIGVKFHGYEMYQYAPNFKIRLQHYMLRRFVKKINQKADYVFSYGGKITNIISDINVDENKILEIPSAINKSWINEKKLNISKTIKFLFVGRFEERKGIKEINSALVKLSKESINAEFHFVGPIPVKNQIKLNNIKVIYHGIIKNEELLKKIYDCCDILLIPSYSEGMPNVILEAMSRGLAIIATDVGAVQLLVSKKNGILLNNCNDILIQKAIIDIVLMDKKLILEMKENSIQKIKENFLWENIIFKFLNSLDI